MDGEAANLPVRVAPAAIASRPAIETRETTTTTSSSSSTLSPPAPGFLHYVEAALKRHRPLGGMPSHNLKPRRFLVPSQNKQEAILFKELQKADVHSLPSKGMDSLVDRTPVDPSITESMHGSCNTVNVQTNQPKSDVFDDDRDLMPLSNAVSPINRLKKVQFSVGETAVSQGALTETEWNHNLIEASTVIDRDLKQQSLPNRDVDAILRSDVGISSSLAKRTALVQDQLHPFRTFLKQPAISQTSGMGTSCATTTSVHSTSAPILNNTTYTSRSQQDDVSQLGPESVGYLKSSRQSVTEEHQHHLHEIPLEETVATADGRSANIDALLEIENLKSAKEETGKMEKQTAVLKDPASSINHSVQGKNSATDNHRQVASSLEGKMGPQSGKQDKVGSSKGAAASSRRNYDPDCFFKVNGKLYQRLGKIGSGGSSEVHKVISSDCTIYALKKIKLKGRDYSTAYGFCQEIKYLNRLKGKDNIIQLIDYEVTDKALLEEVMSDTMSNKDGRIKDDGYIYMILEYGEIDLARMLCQEWKKLDSSGKAIDENWLRFYWQQILHAVNIIHEERIVHSDLKPANFLLVRGSLKLIDFGIAKAISCDTTNIQRDSQVGTLSYMSPEAFMCNESDPNGNVIKCGRPSDIWSLGCILYQMVYGRTPFSEYKTFWSKFKVITDPNHEITYEPLANPWLLDLMKKCLVWDRNQRWRIPQLLEHPFLVPPVPSNMSSFREQGCEMIRIISKACREDQEASALCSKLKQLLEEPMTELKCQSSVTSRSSDQQFLLLSHVSNVCLQIQKYLMKSEQT